jgi:hypothetical protein
MAAGSEPPVPPALRPLRAAETGEIELGELLRRLWDRIGLILLCTAIGTAGAVSYALLATPIYRAEALLSIRVEEPTGALVGLTGQLGGLADLAGLSIPGAKDKGVAVATLRSRAVIEQFIADRQLVDVLIAPGEGRGLTGDDRPPTVWDAHRKFVNQVFKVVEDKKTGLVTVAVEWKDPQQATDWVTDLVARTNARLRSVAIAESEKNLAYLESQARNTHVVEIRQALFRLAENEIKKLMLAKGAGEYVFKTVDPARVPERWIRPKRALLCIGGFVLGATFGMFLVLVLPPRRPRAAARAHNPTTHVGRQVDRAPQRRQRAVLVGQQRWLPQVGPRDADVGVVPGQAAFRRRVVVLRALVEKVGLLRQHQEAVRETRRHVQHPLADVVELGSEPAAEPRGPATHVHHHVEHASARHAHQLSLGPFELVMQAAQGAAARARMVVLHEARRQAGLRQPGFAKRLHKEPACVAVHRRLEHDHAGQGGWGDLHGRRDRRRQGRRHCDGARRPASCAGPGIALT